MEIIKKILTFVFNPLSVMLSGKKSTEGAENFAKRGWLVALIAILFTALLLFIIWFLY